MRRLPDLRRRSTALELMDDPRIVGPELREALRQLRAINLLLIGFWPTLEGVDALWRANGRPPRLVVLDVGGGSGDTDRLLQGWAAWRGIGLRIVLVDIERETCREAAAFNRADPNIHVVQADLYAAPIQSCDIVTASLVLHHIADADVPRMLAALQRVARLGVVVNDLHRNIVAWSLIAVLTRVFSRNRMIRHDAPLSVARGFRAADFRSWRQHPHLSDIRWWWRPFFRFLVLLPPAESEQSAVGRDGGVSRYQ